MGIQELPLTYMLVHISCPRPEALDWLNNYSIPDYIKRKYPNPEDQGSAFDGAFTGFHIHAHVSRNKACEQEWLDEVLGWYDWFGKKHLNGSFYDALEETLKSCGMEEFYKRAVDNIIDNKGKLSD
ncbi:hypothetical protein KY312_02305 [Candidatus Woesearchaeota archaeon]|nr:hypothetical protein [Candidatus Woesearchaeota archaeon]